MIKQDSHNTEPAMNWRLRAYMMWAGIGTFFGVAAGYLYVRAAQEYADRNSGNPPRIETGQLIGLLLAALAVIRQVTQLGKPEDPKKK